MQVKCGSCGRVDHRTQDCKFLGYHPNKLLIIGRHNYRRKQRLKKYHRKPKRTSNALKNLSMITNSINDFITDMEEDEDFKDVMGIYSAVEADSAISIDVQSQSKSRNRINDDFKEHDDENAKTIVKLNKNVVRNPNSLDLAPIDKNNYDSLKLLKKTSNIDTKYSKNPSRIENIWDFFFLFDKLKNYKFFFPKNNAESIVIKMQSKFFPQSKSYKFLFYE